MSDDYRLQDSLPRSSAGMSGWKGPASHRSLPQRAASLHAPTSSHARERSLGLGGSSRAPSFAAGFFIGLIFPFGKMAGGIGIPPLVFAGASAAGASIVLGRHHRRHRRTDPARPADAALCRDRRAAHLRDSLRHARRGHPASRLGHPGDLPVADADLHARHRPRARPRAPERHADPRPRRRACRGADHPSQPECRRARRRCALRLVSRGAADARRCSPPATSTARPAGRRGTVRCRSRR